MIGINGWKAIGNMLLTNTSLTSLDLMGELTNIDIEQITNVEE